MRLRPEPAHYVGIDFGTSKCVTTWYNPRRDEADVVRSQEGEDQTPSVVYYPEDSEPVVGKEALQVLDDYSQRGEYDRYGEEQCRRVVLSAKRHIARRMRFMFPPYPTPRQVAADIFRKLRRNLTERHFHFPVTHAVVTVPAAYDQIQRQCIRDAALDAGFERVVLVDEPTAAAIAYYREAVVAQNIRDASGPMPQLGDVFMVYDLGAGTFDLAVLKRNPGEMGAAQYEVALKPSGMAFGGDDIDLALYTYLDRIAQERHGRPISSTSEISRRFLMQCRKAKVSLGEMPATTVSALLVNSSERFQQVIKQADYYELIRPLLQNTVEPMQRLVERAVKENLGRKDGGFPLDNIILIGGSSRIPLIKPMLEEQFNIKIYEWEKQDLAVALGAAYLAYDLFRPDSPAFVSMPPVVAARVAVEIPPLVPTVLNAATQQPEAITLNVGTSTVAKSNIERGLHVAFNVPPGKIVLYPQLGRFAAQAVEVQTVANTLHRVRLEYDPNTQTFTPKVQAEGVLSTNPNGSLERPSSWEEGRMDAETETPETLPAYTDADDICAELRSSLLSLATALRDAGVRDETPAEFERLAEGILEPCVVAVVGRVKAGKSTFVNALLGADLAKVGAVETTATINRFAFGKSNPERPVICHRRDGTTETVSKSFLDGLQGNTEEVLARARSIEYLEYKLENKFLERIVLVDTPGMNAAVAEHNERVEEFLGVEKELADRTYERSRQVGSRADAVIFVIGQVPRIQDQAFLDAFAEVLYPGTRALNAIGVMAKVDERTEVFNRRKELCKKIQDQLPDKLNIVLPVSAALQRFLDTTDDARLSEIIAQIRRFNRQGDVDAEVTERSVLGFLLHPDRWTSYADPGDPDPVSPEERAALVGDLPWSSFAMMVRQIAKNPNADTAGIRTILEEVAGFVPLRKILEGRFVRRGDLLRAYRIVQRALDGLDRILRMGLPELEARIKEEQARFEQFLTFIQKATITGDENGETTRRELESYVREGAERARHAPKVTQTLRGTERRLTWLLHALQDDHADMDALESLEIELGEHPESFTLDEQKEVREVLGSYGRSVSDRLAGRTEPAPSAVEGRMAYWARIARQGTGTSRRQAIAHIVTQRYGILLDDVLRGTGA